jgi:hypothetical protein
VTTVKRRRKAADQVDLAPVIASFKEFRQHKNAEAAAKRGYEQLRDKVLMPVLERFGQPWGETGAHRAIELPEEVDGFVRIVRRANTSREFDLDAAEKLCADKGVLEQVQTVNVRMTGIPATKLAELRAALEEAGLEDFAPVLIDTKLEQDLVYALHQRDRDLITAAELDELIVEETRYSFFPERA